MRKFTNPINRAEFKNDNGEFFELVMDRNCVIWLYHEAINKDFQKILQLSDVVFTTDESEKIDEFCNECGDIAYALMESF